jgi:hypothetical protein
MSLVQKAWQEGNILTMSLAQRARQGVTQQKSSLLPNLALGKSQVSKFHMI